MGGKALDKIKQFIKILGKRGTGGNFLKVTYDKGFLSQTYSKHPT